MPIAPEELLEGGIEFVLVRLATGALVGTGGRGLGGQILFVSTGQLINSRKQTARMRMDFLSMKITTDWNVVAWAQSMGRRLARLSRPLDQRNRVFPTSTPRMTTPEPFERQPNTPQSAVSRNCLQRISGTCGCKPALPIRSKEKSFGWRYGVTIDSHTSNQNILAGVHCLPSCR